MPQPNIANAAIAARLVQARVAAGCPTLESGALRLGMNPKIYANHEKGRANVKPAELRRYAKVFGASHGWLLTGIGAAPRKLG